MFHLLTVSFGSVCSLQIGPFSANRYSTGILGGLRFGVIGELGLGTTWDNLGQLVTSCCILVHCFCTVFLLTAFASFHAGTQLFVPKQPCCFWGARESCSPQPFPDSQLRLFLGRQIPVGIFTAGTDFGGLAFDSDYPDVTATAANRENDLHEAVLPVFTH
jgi:hypothetical protein